MRRKTFCALCLLVVLCALLLTACEAVPADSPARIMGEWEQAMRNFWNDSFGRIVNPVMAWLNEQWITVTSWFN